AGQALLGALVGVGLHVAVTPALTRLDFGIAPFTTADLLMPWWAYPVLVAALVLLGVGSAAVALTGVVLSPLGVARDSRVVRLSVIRVVVWVMLILGFFVMLKVGTALFGEAGAGMLGLGMIVAFVAAIVAGMNLVGPFIVWVVALGLARPAPTPSLLAGARRPAWHPACGRRGVSGARVAVGLARPAPSPSLMVGARRLAGDPRAGWRAVSGITFALVIAGFLTVISLITRSTGPEDAMLATAMSTGGVLTLGIAAVLAA